MDAIIAYEVHVTVTLFAVLVLQNLCPSIAGSQGSLPSLRRGAIVIECADDKTALSLADRSYILCSYIEEKVFVRRGMPMSSRRVAEKAAASLHGAESFTIIIRYSASQIRRRRAFDDAIRAIDSEFEKITGRKIRLSFLLRPDK